MTVLIYWISYKLLESPGFLITGEEPQTLTVHLPTTPKYNHSGLREESAQQIISVLNTAMNQRKLFLDSGLTIDTLARQLGESKHHLSQVINERFHQTYNEYVNEFRLAEAKSRLQNFKFQHFTIGAIALDCGFNTVSNFNELFKKKFGITPSQCRSQGLGKMTA